MVLISELVLEKLSKIRKSCKKCLGMGFITENTDKGVLLHDCSCIEDIARRTSLLEANLPEVHWNWDFRSLDDAFKKQNEKQYSFFLSYIDNIEKNIDEGNGFWISGSPGLAKSSIASYILRKAIIKGYKAYYMRASHLISEKMNSLRNDDSKFLLIDIINNSSILVMEEMEKVYLKSELDYINQAFYELLSDLYDAKKAIIFTSNIPMKEVVCNFPHFIQDRLGQFRHVPLMGISGRSHGTS